MLRKELVELRTRRDDFLFGRLPLLKPFLPAHDYFSKKPEERNADGVIIGGLGVKSELKTKKPKTPKKPKVIIPRTTSTRRTTLFQTEAGLTDDSMMEIADESNANIVEGYGENQEVEQEQAEETSMEIDQSAPSIANVNQSMVESELGEEDAEGNGNDDQEEEEEEDDEEDDGDDVEDDQEAEDLNASNIEDVTGENPSSNEEEAHKS